MRNIAGYRWHCAARQLWLVGCGNHCPARVCQRTFNRWKSGDTVFRLRQRALSRSRRASGFRIGIDRRRKRRQRLRATGRRCDIAGTRQIALRASGQ